MEDNTNTESQNPEQIDFSALPFSKEEYDNTCTVLAILAQEDHSKLYMSPQCRPLRALLQPLFDRQRDRMFAGKTPEENDSRKQKKIKRAQELERQRREDKEFLQRTVLRAGRMKKLEQIAMMNDCDDIAVSIPLILDGAVNDGFNDSVTLSAGDGQNVCTLGQPSIEADPEAADEASAARLNTSRGCYICKRRYQVLHHFYDTLCESCAGLNWTKRMQTCDLTGRICLVTGARVKIGFQSALKLLRCGAIVIATSRFPGDTALRYAMQSDYKDWGSRLHVFGVDLRDLAAIEELCAYLNSNFPWLDCIINNACQTIRRPPAYYADVIETERRVAAMCRGDATRERTPTLITEAPDYTCNLSNHWKYQSACEKTSADLIAASMQKVIAGPTGQDVISEGSTSSSYLSSVDRAEVVMVASDGSLAAEVFPEQRRDVNSQQLDLRRHNSWLLTLSSGDISTPELVEVFAINAMAPFILASKLKPLLTARRPAPQDQDSPNENKSSVLVSTTPATYQRSLAETVLQDLTGKLTSAAEEGFSDDRSAKRQRNAWKGGGDISGHFLITCNNNASDEPNSDKNNNKSKVGSAPEAVRAADCRFIINVSSMEGKFYRRKLATHPHTNMAKAALNMLTRTSAAEYEKHGIYMTAVDTGWINDENPIERAAKTAEKHNFATPLDEIDAAARILDPMLGPLKAAEDSTRAVGAKKGEAMCSPPFGCFLKDYFPTEW